MLRVVRRKLIVVIPFIAIVCEQTSSIITSLKYMCTENSLQSLFGERIVQILSYNDNRKLIPIKKS